MTGDVAESTRQAAVAGERIVSGNIAGTIVFVVTAVLAAAFFTSTFQWIGAITALTLFAIGVFAFLWAYFHAVGRSRTEEIGVAQLYVMTGPPTPPTVRRTMMALLAVQVLTATITTFARLDGPDGNPGSSLAVGFLVPMLGFGLNGLWVAFHGTFPPRRLRPGVADVTAAAPARPESRSPTKASALPGESGNEQE